MLGELSDPFKVNDATKLQLSIDGYLNDWRAKATIPIAGDLLSAAYVNNFRNVPEVIEAAKFIITNREEATQSQIAIASMFLKNVLGLKPGKKIDAISASTLDKVINPKPIRIKIKILKRHLTSFPSNPVTLIELSRLYSILGQENKAVRHMNMAMHFGNENRFVLRSASRLFAHYGDLEKAHDILRRSALASVDPWITAAEISLAEMRGRHSKFIKKGIHMVESGIYSEFSTSELASALGTAELFNGTIKKSRELFRRSLIAPNDNSLAQAEWASNKEVGLSISAPMHGVEYGFEAEALYHYNEENYVDALNAASKWLVDMPFSKRPSLLGAHVAGALLDDLNTAIIFCKAGLASHPNDPQLINNIVYCLLLLGRIEEAESYMNQILVWHELEKTTEICLRATAGLYYFRKGEREKGRRYYWSAIEDARSIRHDYFANLALLNLTREEILTKSDQILTLMALVDEVPPLNNHLKKLKQDVNELHAQNWPG